MIFDFQFEHEWQPKNTYCDHCRYIIKTNAYHIRHPVKGVICGECYASFNGYMKGKVEDALDEYLHRKAPMTHTSPVDDTFMKKFFGGLKPL